MLTAQQLALAKGGSAGSSPTQAMSPEDAQAWIGSTPVAPQSSILDNPIIDSISHVIPGASEAVTAARAATEIPEVGSELNTRMNNTSAINNSNENAPSKLLQDTGEGAGAINDVAGEAIKAVVPPQILESLGAHLAPLAQSAMQSPAGKAVLNWFGGLDPETQKNLSATGSIASLLSNALGAEGGAAAVEPAMDAGKAASDAAIEAAGTAKQSLKIGATPTPEETNAAIIDNYTKAIKPSVAGKGSLATTNSYNDSVVGAVKSIAENKDNLKFTTQDGEEVTGRTPETPAETAQAIDQTKRTIFDQYDALTKQATGAGVSIDTAPVATELDKVINNQALKISHPEAVQYAQDLKSRFAQNLLPDGSPVGYKKLDPEVTQDLIKNYNNSLDAFYKNPTYDNASKAAIDAGVAHSFRDQLGKSIESATGADYAGLKKQYGALANIEKDVNKRVSVLARQQGGLSNYADIFSGGDMVSGILSLNPALFAKGAAQKGLTTFFKYLNSPDRAIKNMFKAAQ